MNIKRIIKKIVTFFLQVRYTGDRVELYLHLGKLGMKDYSGIKLPFTFSRTYAFDKIYSKNEVVPNKVVIDNYMGKGYGCNGKYVADKLLEKYPGKLDLVWVVSPEDAQNSGVPEGIKTVEYGTSDALKAYASAKVWVSNYHKIALIHKGVSRKPDQHFIQMWHGSLGIKKIENHVASLTEDENWLDFAQQSSRMVTHWISNSAFETNVYREAFWDVENILEYGHPRNDVMFGGTDAARKKVEDFFGLQGKKIMFYAPTFREDYRLDCYKINYARLRQGLHEKFGGDWVFLVRMHPRVREFSAQVVPNEPYMIDATYYPDIQELLAASDSMITDYSSCIFDFMLTRRPAFIFATDVDEYDQERGFYYPLESTPFPVAHDNDEFMANVAAIDLERYRAEVEEFLIGKGCVEDGCAAERVADLIAELTGII